MSEYISKFTGPQIEEKLDQVAINKEQLNDLNSYAKAINIPIHGFVDEGQSVNTAIANLTPGDNIFCINGVGITGESPKIELVYTQSTQKAIYIKSIEISYHPWDEEIGGYVEEPIIYSYTFSGKTFYENNTTVNLGGINWTISAILENDAELYCGYSTTKGQQFGSSSQQVLSLSFYTHDINNCLISLMTVETSGATATKATLSVNCDDVSSIVANLTATSSVYEPLEDVAISSISSFSYINKLITKDESGSFVVTDPSIYSTFTDLKENRLYRYNGSKLVEVAKILNLGYTKDTAYRGDLGQANYEEIQKLKGAVKLKYNNEEAYYKASGVELGSSDVIVSTDGGSYLYSGSDSGYNYKLLLNIPVEGDGVYKENGIRTPGIETEAIINRGGRDLLLEVSKKLIMNANETLIDGNWVDLAGTVTLLDISSYIDYAYGTIPAIPLNVIIKSDIKPILVLNKYRFFITNINEENNLYFFEACHLEDSPVDGGAEDDYQISISWANLELNVTTGETLINYWHKNLYTSEQYILELSPKITDLSNRITGLELVAPQKVRPLRVGDKLAGKTIYVDKTKTPYWSNWEISDTLTECSIWSDSYNDEVGVIELHDVNTLVCESYFYISVIYDTGWNVSSFTFPETGFAGDIYFDDFYVASITSNLASCLYIED